MNKIITLLSFIILISCQTEKKEEKVENIPHNTVTTHNNLKYSKCFQIIKENNIKKLIISDPFLNYKVQKTLVLLKQNQEYTPKPNEITIQIPIKTVIPFSTSYLSMIDTLGEINSIKAIENENYIYNSTLLEKVNNKEIKAIGSIEQLNLESILILNPDLLITIGNSGETPKQIQKLEQAGIPYVNNYDWQENHPLGKAEWIKFFGALYDKEKLANDIFDQIELNYNNLKAKSNNNKPNVLFSSLYNGVWYIPGGNSYGSQFLKDAGGTHPWINDSTKGSLPLSFETIVNKQSSSDIWLNPNYTSLESMLLDDARYKPFLKTVKGRIYMQNKRSTPSLGNDYWETGSLRPDLILKDYVQLLKLDECNDDSLYFFQKIKN